jgi:hypothetical protein
MVVVVVGNHRQPGGIGGMVVVGSHRQPGGIGGMVVVVGGHQQSGGTVEVVVCTYRQSVASVVLVYTYGKTASALKRFG